MAEFAEFDDGDDLDLAADFLNVGGDGGAEGGAADDDPRKEAFKRDAVLFLLDARESMFHAATDSDAQQHSPFANAVRCALTFYQDKVITSDRDLVGCVLYNCKQFLNVYEFQHIYVFHEMDHPSAPRVQELDCLARCGVKGAKGYANFTQTIGHCPPTERAPLSEALWAAQHMMNHVPKSVATKRIFIFTDNANPPGGDALERDRCYARMKDLFEANVQLEVWAHGFDPATAAAATTASGARASVASSSADGGGVAAATVGSSSGGGGTVGSGSADAPNFTGTPLSLSPPRPTPMSENFVGLPAKAARREPPPGVPIFDSDSFWNRLLAVPRSCAMAARRGGGAAIGGLGGGQVPPSDPFAYLGQLINSGTGVAAGSGNSMLFGGGGWTGSALEADDGLYAGRVHVADFSTAATFVSLLESVRERIWAQRTIGRLEMTIGTGGTAATTFPRVAVQVFLPVMRCKKPHFTWIEGATNAVVTSETRLVLRETGAEIAYSDIISAVRVGDVEIRFNKNEIALMKGQFGNKGLTILGFKSCDAVKFKHSISRSAFIHPVTGDSENAESIRLFVQLHRSLAAKHRVAIAQLVARPGAAPRLVALMPNTDPRDEAVLGLGFHMVYLPYADDIRSVRVNDPKHPRKVAAPDEDIVVKAKKVIRELQNDVHDYKAVENPVLQRHYHVLQQLALCDDTRPAPQDSTLPDKDGMSRPKVKKHMKEFIDSAFPPGYSPEVFCPTPKPAKPPPSKDELAAIDFDKLERDGKIATLTIPYLKEYLKQNNSDTSQAKVKADYVELVTSLVRKKRAAGAPDGTVKVKEESF